MPIRYTKSGKVDKRSEQSMKNLEKSSMYQAMQEKKKMLEKNITELPVEKKKEDEVVADDEYDDDDEEDDEYEIQEKKPIKEPVVEVQPVVPVVPVMPVIEKPPIEKPPIEKKTSKKKKKIIVIDSDEEDDDEELKVVSKKKYEKIINQYEKNLIDMKLKNEEMKNSILYNQHLSKLSSIAGRQMKIQI